MMPNTVTTAPSAALPGYRHDAYRTMGAHPINIGGLDGWHFRVWAPNAKAVSVVGVFNRWDITRHPMVCKEGNGIWTGFVPGLQQYDLYQFAITTQDDKVLYKADPYAFHADTRPNTASKLYDLAEYQWGDQAWMAYRAAQPKNRPINIYQLHLSSWRRTGNGEVLNYRGLADYLVPYVKELGYTHVLMMPPMEHPDDSSFGYQITGYFAATSRMGTPDDFKYLIDQLHQAGVGVLIDWIPGGTPAVDFGLCQFDGTHCYERPESGSFFNSFDFDFSKPEVCDFFTSAQFFWIEQFHADGMRIIKVPKDGAHFIAELGELIHSKYPDVMTIRPNVGGTEYSLIVDSTWTGKALSCLSKEPSKRRGPAMEEGSIYPRQIACLGHEQVTPPSLSVARRMSGDDWVRFATVRAFYLVFMTRPGHKLTMMGTEFGQWSAWQYQQSLDWHLLNYDFYQKQNRFFRSMNALFLSTPAFWADNPVEVLLDEKERCLLAFARTGGDGKRYYVAANFTGETVQNLHVPAEEAGSYEVIFSSDDASFGGRAEGSTGVLQTIEDEEGPQISVTLPSNAAIILRKV